MTCTLNKNFLSPYNPKVQFTPNLQKFGSESVVFGKHRTEAGLSGVAFASIYTGSQAQSHGVFTHPTRLSNSVYDVTDAFAEDGYDVFLWDAQPMCSKELNYAQGAPSENVFKRILQSGDPKLTEILERIARDPDYKALLITTFTLTHGPYAADHLGSFVQIYPEECQILNEITQEEFQKYVGLYRRNYHALRFDFAKARSELNLTPEDVSKLSRVLEMLYKSNVNFLDRWFGALLGELDDAEILDESLIVFTADHGESLYEEHGPFNWSHAHTLKGNVLDVPLIIRAAEAGIEPGRFDGVTRSVDLFPTLVGLAGIQLAEEMTVMGVDLSDIIKGPEDTPELLAYSHTAMIPPVSAENAIGGLRQELYPRTDMELTWVAVRDGDTVWKYKNQGDERFGFEAFNLRDDPAETNDLFDSENPRDQQMAERLVQYKDQLVRAHKQWTQRRNQDAESSQQKKALEKLRSLGYVK
jgi:arylsulfatase A-like enzyme